MHELKGAVYAEQDADTFISSYVLLKVLHAQLSHSL